MYLCVSLFSFFWLLRFPSRSDSYFSEDIYDDGDEVEKVFLITDKEPSVGMVPLVFFLLKAFFKKNFLYSGNAMRYVYLILAVFFSVTLSGVIFGWPALILILEDENVYSNVCDPDNTSTSPCGAQSSKFNLIYVIATTGFSFAVLPLGFVLDKFGPKISALIGSGLMIAGSLLFAFSSNDFDAFIPAYLLIGIGGPPIVFSFMHISNLFPKNKGTIITMLNVALDASAMVFVLFDLIHSALPETATYKWLFVGYAVVPAFSFVTAIFLWPMKPFQEPEPEFTLEAEDFDLLSSESDSDMEVTNDGTLVRDVSCNFFFF